MEVEILEDTEAGFKISLPRGTQYKRLQTGYIFGHPDYEGLIMLLFHYNKNLEEMKQDMDAGFYDESGFNLQVEGQLREINESMILANYKGIAQGLPAVGYGIGMLSPYKGGILIAIVSNPSAFDDAYMDLVDDLARLDLSSLVDPRAGDLAEHDTGKNGDLVRPDRLEVAGLRKLGAARQRNVLRFAIRACGLPPAPATRLRQVQDGAVGGPAERAGAEVGVVALLDEEVLGFVVQFERQLAGHVTSRLVAREGKVRAFSDRPRWRPRWGPRPCGPSARRRARPGGSHRRS